MTKAEELTHGVLSRVAEDEPVFVLRAADVIAPTLVRMWAEQAEAHGSPPKKVNEALNLATSMEAWQRDHLSRTKVPD